MGTVFLFLVQGLWGRGATSLGTCMRMPSGRARSWRTSRLPRNRPNCLTIREWRKLRSDTLRIITRAVIDNRKPSGVPGIDHWNPRLVVVASITSDNRQAVVNGRRRDDQVRLRECVSRFPAFLH